MRYQVVFYKEDGDWLEPDLKMAGGWGNSFCLDLREAVDTVEEWGSKANGEPYKYKKVGIYDHEWDETYSYDKCLRLHKEIWS